MVCLFLSNRVAKPDKIAPCIYKVYISIPGSVVDRRQELTVHFLSVSKTITLVCVFVCV